MHCFTILSCIIFVFDATCDTTFSSSSSLTRSHSFQHKDNDHSSEQHFSFRRFFRNIDDKVKAFFKGLPDQLGYEFVMELIDNKFNDIREHLKQHKSSRPHPELKQINSIFSQIEKTNTQMKEKVEKMHEKNPELLVKSSKDNLAKNEAEELLQSAMISLVPKTGAPQNNDLLSAGTLLIQVMGMFKDLDQRYRDLLQNKATKHDPTTAAAPQSQANPTQEKLKIINPSTDSLKATISNFQSFSVNTAADSAVSLATLLAEMTGIDVAQVQERAQEYFIRGIDVTRFKIETCMKKEEENIVNNPESRAKHAVAVALHAILHFADQVAKPIVVFALIAAVAGCIIGVMTVPAIAAALLPIMQTLVGIITTLAKQIFDEWTNHPTVNA